MWKQLQPADKIIDLTLEEDEVKQEEAVDTEAFPAAEGPTPVRRCPPSVASPERRLR